MRLLDPKDYIPDILLELNFENLIIELQSTDVDDEFSKRGLTYVAVANRDKENNKEVNLVVLSTSEESKTIHYKFNKDSVFTYDIVSLSDLDGDAIINSVEPKIKQGLEIESEELVLYALIPMIKGEQMEKYIKRVIHNLLQAKATTSIKNLSYGIEWLIVDKFIEDEEYRQVLCDRLSDRMSLIYEYGDRREQKGWDEGWDDGREKGLKEILSPLINSGETLPELSQKTGKTIKELEEILKD